MTLAIATPLPLPRAVRSLCRERKPRTTPFSSGRAFCQLGFERLGSSSWLCHSRAHLDEQNGSPLRRATSGRAPPQHTQRPSGCTGGFAFSGGCFSTCHEPIVSRHARGGAQPAGGLRASLPPRPRSTGSLCV